MPMKFWLLEIPESENFYNHVDYKKAILLIFEENKRRFHSFTSSSELLSKLYSPCTFVAHLFLCFYYRKFPLYTKLAIPV